MVSLMAMLTRTAVAFIAAALFFTLPAAAQQTNAPTTNGSVSITLGNTFQTVLNAVGTPPAIRRSLTIENNNTNGDSCWLFIGAGAATKATSIALAQGASYQRYFPYVPSDAIQATCATTSDTLYVDTQ
jgi:hypothetical protein